MSTLGAGSISAEPVSRDGAMLWEDVPPKEGERVVRKAGTTVTWLSWFRCAFSMLLLCARYCASADAGKTIKEFFLSSGTLSVLGEQTHNEDT